MDRPDPKLPSDGRHMRSERTKQALIKAYLDLLIERQKPPTAPEIAKRAGCSARSIFERFSDLLTLSLAATDQAFEEAMSQAAVPNPDADLRSRLKAHVAARAAICERWLTLWRALLRYQSESEDLAIRIKSIRAAMVARIELMYRPELSMLPKAERFRLIVAMGILMDFESWGSMREGDGLSIEAARDVWMTAIAYMLPAVSLKPEPSNLPASA